MSRVLPYLLVGFGGFLGAIARFLMARWVGVLVETRFPLGTLLINVSGSFLLGVIGTIVAQKVFANSDAVRLASDSWAPSRRSPHSRSKRTRCSRTGPG
jgi:fluoride ion exporter CrcB/FEX